MSRLDKKAVKKYNKFIAKKYKNGQDDRHLFGVGITDEEFVRHMTKIVLGEEWFVALPLSHNQMNELVFEEILDKLNKRWRKWQ